MAELNFVNNESEELKECHEVCLNKALTGNDEPKEDLDFNHFNWSSEKNNLEESITDSSNSCKKDSQTIEDSKPIELKENDSTCPNDVSPKYLLPVSLIIMPKDIPFDDIPSLYTKSIEDVLNLTAEERVEFAKDAKLAFERREDENLIAAKLCRLHPSNARFNQGVVENPPPITPSKMVEFTPGGQRYEVDLNEGRPTTFRSEYSRMQYDDATILNHTRMMADVKDGRYLPKSLNDNIERRFIAQQKMVENMFKEVFELDDSDIKSCPDNDSSDDSDVDLEEFKFLEVELKLLQFHKEVAVAIQDRPVQCLGLLQELLTLDLQPIIFVKNPQILELIKKLMKQTQYADIQIAAIIFYEKIMSCFDLPEGVSFEQYFQLQVEDLNQQLTANKDTKSILKAILYRS